MPGPQDIVRPFQLPGNTPEQLYLSQYNLAANTPIFVTPGFGAASPFAMPPILLGAGHYDITVGHYCVQAMAETKTATEGG